MPPSLGREGTIHQTALRFKPSACSPPYLACISHQTPSLPSETTETGDRDQFCLMGPPQEFLPEDGDRIRSPKRRVLKEDRATDNVHSYDSYGN
jgi:hypothetical protein